MRTVYITEQGAKLYKEHQRLLVRKDKEILAAFHSREVSRVLVFGNVQITTQALAALMEQGTDIAYLSSYGRLRGHTRSTHSTRGTILLAQCHRYMDPNYRLQFAKAVLSTKLLSQQLLIQRHRRNHPDDRLEQILQSLKEHKQQVVDADSLNQIMGWEGFTSRLYFAAFSLMNRHPTLQFERRQRRPPRDPINAMLSLGYSLLTHEITSAIVAHGLNPYLGLLHGMQHARSSLALDLIEPFRAPIVDRWILNLLNNQWFEEEDFESSPEHGVRFHDHPLKTFLRLWEERLRSPSFLGEQTPRSIFQQQVVELEDAMLQGRTFVPVILPEEG